MKHSIELTSVSNARELGGFLAHGRAIRPGRLLRTSFLSDASPSDLTRLETVYHVAAVVDFRMSVEQAQHPDPVIPGAENLSLPVIEPEDFPGAGTANLGSLLDPHGDRLGALLKAAESRMLNDQLYGGFLLRGRGKAAYGQFFQVLLNLPEDRAILWHCTDGKDRTGIASMLLLSALGASRETILEDYLLTNEYNKQKLDAVQAALDGKPLTPELRELALFGVGAVYERYLLNAIIALADAYGSVDGYLARELGIGKAERAILREKFLEP